MKALKYFLSAAFLLTISTCTKDDDKPATVSEAEELSYEEVDFFDEQEEDFVDIDEITLPNGENIIDFILEYDPDFLDDLKSTSHRAAALGPQTIKNLTLAKMQVKAHFLVDDSKHQFTGIPEEGFPVQDGLAYSFGSKDYTIRQTPPAGECKAESVVGLDCSGYVYHLFQAAGIDIPEGTADLQRQVTTLNNAIKTQDDFKKVRFEDFEQIPTSEFEAGDIIYWLKSNGVAKHIGMVLKKSSGQLRIYQSNGTSKQSGNCTDNYSKKRGPRIIRLNDYNWFGSSYGIVRMVTDISGNWSALLRCEGQVEAALTLAFEIPVIAGGNFTATGNGTDYNGDAINAVIEGEYDKQKNTINGVIEMTFPSNPDGNREDAFEVRLDKDETEYFVMTKVVVNGGCVVEMKLKNNEAETAAPGIKQKPGNSGDARMGQP